MPVLPSGPARARFSHCSSRTYPSLLPKPATPHPSLLTSPVCLVIGVSRKTEPIGYMHIYRKIYYERLAHATMEACHRQAGGPGQREAQDTWAQDNQSPRRAGPRTAGGLVLSKHLRTWAPQLNHTPAGSMSVLTWLRLLKRVTSPTGPPLLTHTRTRPTTQGPSCCPTLVHLPGPLLPTFPSSDPLKRLFVHRSPHQLLTGS